MYTFWFVICKYFPTVIDRSSISNVNGNNGASQFWHISGPIQTYPSLALQPWVINYCLQLYQNWFVVVPHQTCYLACFCKRIPLDRFRSDLNHLRSLGLYDAVFPVFRLKKKSYFFKRSCFTQRPTTNQTHFTQDLTGSHKNIMQFCPIRLLSTIRWSSSLGSPVSKRKDSLRRIKPSPGNLTQTGFDVPRGLRAFVLQ